jgi:hypothetical protein
MAYFTQKVSLPPIPMACGYLDEAYFCLKWNRNVRHRFYNVPSAGYVEYFYLDKVSVLLTDWPQDSNTVRAGLLVAQPGA